MKSRKIFLGFCSVIGFLFLMLLSSCAEKKVEIVDFELNLFTDDDSYAGEVRSFSLRNTNGIQFEQTTENGEIA